MEQPDLFTGAELRDFGIQAAEHDREQMTRLIDDAIDWYSKHGPGFTAEDVRTGFGPNISRHPDFSKVIGGRIRAAALRGDIFTLGETLIAGRPSAHSRRMLIWYGKGNA
jgi:hypothetical protein